MCVFVEDSHKGNLKEVTIGSRKDTAGRQPSRLALPPPSFVLLHSSFSWVSAALCL